LSDYPTTIDRPRIVEIREVRLEAPNVKTFTFYDEPCGKAEAGQFVMVWIPGVDEVPMSLSAMQSNGYSSITVDEVGEATRAIHRRKSGDFIGIRGPYGRGFEPIRGKALVVGGGTGIIPLTPLTEQLARLQAKITFLIGAKSKDELLFLNRIRTALSEVEARVITTTEDGSSGLRGLVTDQMGHILAKARFDFMYTCGPERMMHKAYLWAEKYHVPMQASLERFMRCAIGLCGSCVIGRFRVCKDGPVFSSEQLREVENEFGRFKRDCYGRKIEL